MYGSPNRNHNKQRWYNSAPGTQQGVHLNSTCAGLELLNDGHGRGGLLSKVYPVKYSLGFGFLQLLWLSHYTDVIMSAIASQITSLAILYSTVYSGTNQRKHQSSASLAFVRGIQRWPVNSPHKRPVTRKMFPFDDVIMLWFFNVKNVNRKWLWKG